MSDPILVLLFPAVLFCLFSYREHHLFSYVLLMGWPVLVAFLLFVCITQTRRYTPGSFQLLLGATLLAVAVLDVIQVAAHPEVGVIAGAEGVSSLQIWRGSRLLYASSLLLAPWLSRRRLRLLPVLGVYAFWVTVILVVVFHWQLRGVCPLCGKAVGEGFRRCLDGAVLLMLLGGGVGLYSEHRRLDPALAYTVIGVTLLSLLAELLFGITPGEYPWESPPAHLVRGLAYYVLYRGVVLRRLRHPFELNQVAAQVIEEKSEEMRRSLALFHDALNGARDALGVVDLEARVLFCNEAFRRVWKIPDEASSGTILTAFAPALVQSLKTPKRFRQRLEQFAATPSAASFDVLSFRDGRVMECATTPFRVDGEIGGRFWSFHDISRRRRLEVERNKLRDSLAHATRVTAMGQLVGSIAHEINQPLAAMMTNAAAGLRMLASEQPDLEELGAALQDLVDDVRKAAQVIQRLREFLRKETMQLQEVDINFVIRAICDMLHAPLEQRRLVLTTQLQPDLPPVVGDPVQLQQVVLNLIMNAMDAIEALEHDQGGRDIQVRSRVSSGQVQVSVQDSGVGLAVDEITLFEPFYSTKPNGLGIGLPICRTIIEDHGGRLWSEALTGCGSMFHFSLPIAAGAETRQVSGQQDVTERKDGSR